MESIVISDVGVSPSVASVGSFTSSAEVFVDARVAATDPHDVAVSVRHCRARDQKRNCEEESCFHKKSPCLEWGFTRGETKIFVIIGEQNTVN